jgi:Protein of unknown function (DUF433)
MDCHDRIVIDPQIRFGKPTVRGTRITVGDVLSYLASGMSDGDEREGGANSLAPLLCGTPSSGSSAQIR